MIRTLLVSAAIVACVAPALADTTVIFSDGTSYTVTTTQYGHNAVVTVHKNESDCDTACINRAIAQANVFNSYFANMRAVIAERAAALQAATDNHQAGWLMYKLVGAVYTKFGTYPTHDECTHDAASSAEVYASIGKPGTFDCTRIMPG